MNRRKFLVGTGAAVAAAVASAPAMAGIGAGDVTSIFAVAGGEKKYLAMWFRVEGAEECVRAFEQISRRFVNLRLAPEITINHRGGTNELQSTRMSGEELAARLRLLNGWD